MTGRHPAAAKGADFFEYPFLSDEEFAEVCHHLDRLYRHATLGPLRRRWRLSVCTALSTAFVAGSEYTTYIQITRPLEDGAELEDGDLAGQLDRFSLSPEGGTEADEAMAEAEDADEAALPKQPPKHADVGFVTYEIHRHPTYQAPCLWFSLHGLADYEPAFNIDTVFRRLVPNQFKNALRTAGSIGGISVDHHPITGVPTFFVHPCLLGEAMAHFDCSKESYLMVWIGLVGGCVGLWVPKEMAVLQDA